MEYYDYDARSNTGIVIVFENKRYFSCFKKKLVTAWSLPGAKIFNTWNPLEWIEVCEVLHSKGYKFEVKTVVVF